MLGGQTVVGTVMVAVAVVLAVLVAFALLVGGVGGVRLVGWRRWRGWRLWRRLRRSRRWSGDVGGEVLRGGLGRLDPRPTLPSKPMLRVVTDLEAQ